MKKAVLTILQFFLFFFIFFFGSFFPPFDLKHVLIATPGTTRIFIADGLLLMFFLYIVIIAVEVQKKRLRTAVPWTTVAFVLATVFGLMLQFGFKTLSAF